MKLYLVVNPEGTYLVNITPANADEMKERGWSLYGLGLADPRLVPGVIATLKSTSPLFEANKKQVRRSEVEATT